MAAYGAAPSPANGAAARTAAAALAQHLPGDPESQIELGHAIVWRAAEALQRQSEALQGEVAQLQRAAEAQRLRSAALEQAATAFADEKAALVATVRSARPLLCLFAWLYARVAAAAGPKHKHGAPVSKAIPDPSLDLGRSSG